MPTARQSHGGETAGRELLEMWEYGNIDSKCGKIGVAFGDVGIGDGEGAAG